MKKKLLLVLLVFGLSLASLAQTVCTQCNGYGKLRCAACNGYGKVSVTNWDPYYGYYTVQVPCNTCGGVGYFLCTKCSGTGVVYNVTFGDSCQSKYGGKKCSHRKNGKECKCPGFDGSNDAPCICRHCGHPASEHTK